jgi:Resolvase, N terminal domain
MPARRRHTTANSIATPRAHPPDTSTPTREAMANMLVGFSQFERRLISQRTKGGACGQARERRPARPSPDASAGGGEADPAAACSRRLAAQGRGRPERGWCADRTGWGSVVCGHGSGTSYAARRSRDPSTRRRRASSHPCNLAFRRGAWWPVMASDERSLPSTLTPAREDQGGIRVVPPCQRGGLASVWAHAPVSPSKAAEPTSVGAGSGTHAVPVRARDCNRIRGRCPR